MRRIVKLSLIGIAAGVSACKSADLSQPTEDPRYAGVRFINAVPDSAGAFGLDFRFVDLLESNAHFRIAFRNSPSASPGGISATVQYKGAREGARHFRIFLDDSLQSIASTVLKDSTVNITTQHNYTAMLWGNARSAAAAPDAMRLSFWEEDVADPGAGKVALRVINATPNAIDAWAFTGATAPATATWAAVPAYSRSAYVVVDSAVYTYQIRNAGVGTNLFANTTALKGVVAQCGGALAADITATNPSGCKNGAHPDVDPIAGTQVGGSAVSAIVFPRSTAGARTPQTTAFSVPTLTYVWDKRPPRICTPYC